MTDLSVIIPARNEEFLQQTISSVVDNLEGDTEIIVILDGYWPETSIKDHPCVILIYHSESIGQRAAVNEGAKYSQAKYLMKLDAHCSVNNGFDVKMMDEMKDDLTMVPIMRNLHAFDWVCEDGHRRYQGPSGPCKKCGKSTKKDIVWVGKTNPQSTSYCFDAEPHFQYFRKFKKRKEYKGDLTETMSLQGSCFMVTRDKYFELGLCDESLGSWGSQGIEVACKTWLSGGRVVCNHKTWYGHMFRTQGGDFGFPWPASGKQTRQAKKAVGDLFFNNKWEKQVHPFSWLLDKFWPVPGWTDEQRKAVTGGPTKGIVYYTDNQCEERIVSVVRNHLEKINLPIVSVSLYPISFGNNVVLDLQRCQLTMFKQILKGLETIDTDIVFLCEHDMIYHPSHFDFTPKRNNRYYYNLNCWKLDFKTGTALFYDEMRQTSGLVAYRKHLVRHYKARIERVEREGWRLAIGYEPGKRPPKGIDTYRIEHYMAKYPNIDIRHRNNLTRSRWNIDQYRKKPTGWVIADSIPFWGKTKDRFDEFIKEV